MIQAQEKTKESKKAVILLSGGLDSTTVLEIAREQGYQLYALSFDYGQRHRVELECVRKILARSPVAHHQIVKLDFFRALGGSALTSPLAVPKSDPVADAQKPAASQAFVAELSAANAQTHSVPITYVPARNTIFLSFALAYAETLQAYDIFLGVNQLDYSNYPDCRGEYLQAFERMANLALARPSGSTPNAGIRIHAPLLQMTKKQIIQEGLRLGVDYSLTTSCYDPSDTAQSCGRCDACHLRQNGFFQLGLVDPGK